MEVLTTLFGGWFSISIPYMLVKEDFEEWWDNGEYYTVDGYDLSFWYKGDV